MTTLRGCLVLLALAMIPVTDAHAGLKWGECWLSGGRILRQAECASDTSRHVLAVSLSNLYPVAVFTGIQIVLEISSGSAPYPAGWDFSPGSCGRQRLSISTDLSRPPHESGICSDPWSGRAPVATTSFSRTGGRGWLSVTLALPAGESLELPPGEYLFCLIDLAPAGDCTGCETPVCIGLQGGSYLSGGGYPQGLGDGETYWQSWDCPR